MVPQLLHKLARKGIGKRSIVEAVAKTLLYNLKGTSYGQSVLHFYELLGKGLLKFLTNFLQCFCFSRILHVFVKLHRPVARFKGLRQKRTFLGGHDFCFCYNFKTILLGATKFGKHKKVAPESPSWLRARTNLSSSFYKLIYREPYNADNNIAICPQTHKDVSIVHCVRTYIIVYSSPYRLFLFVAENRLTYSSRPWNDLQVQKQKTPRKSLVMERLVVNARSCSEPQRISKLLYRLKTVDIYLQTVLHQCFHR